MDRSLFFIHSILKSSDLKEINDKPFLFNALSPVNGLELFFRLSEEMRF